MDAIAEGNGARGLDQRKRAALALTDAFLGLPTAIPATLTAQVTAVLSTEEITEICFALVIFHAYVRVIIALGFEPQDMAVTTLPPYGHE